MMRITLLVALAAVSLLAVSGTPAAPVDIASPAAASCIADPVNGGCVSSPVPLPCRPFAGDKFLGNLDICLY